MGDVSKHFSRWEFKCKCGTCEDKAVDSELLEHLEGVREHYDRRVTIKSGWRCEEHNRREGGYPKSKHKDGLAADIVVEGILAEEVQEYLKKIYPDQYGVGSYSLFTHFDVRSGRAARW
jgi:uncharacterized protein YcbK (DUF882 family)